MFKFLGNLFGGGALKSIENIATEWIDTDKETAEAKAILAKAIDPNGKMRRDLSKFASVMYGFYLTSVTILVFMQSFGLGDMEGAKLATASMTDLFTPITVSWSAIVSASFGVNGLNTYKGVK